MKVPEVLDSGAYRLRRWQYSDGRKIDKLVYDPNTKTGELAISMVSGLLRVVGGRISKAGAIKLSTPLAVIGIRGA
jgi:hypothetical protein